MCVARSAGVRELWRSINTEQWERGGRRSKAVSLPGEPAWQTSGIPIHHFMERGGRAINMEEWEQGGRRSKGWLASR